MQQDGNLVVYTASGPAAWVSETYGNQGAYLVVRDDRNMVIYSAVDDPLWASNTSA